MRSPLRFTKAPPLFPIFTTASVCMNDSILSLPRSLMLRAFALMIPAVTVEFKLKGFPTASTHSPTCVLSESAKVRKGNFSSASIFSKAISEEASVPMSLAV